MPTSLKNRGLYTFRNDLDVPEGSLEIANNIVVDEDGVGESRRGFSDYGDLLPLSTDRIKQLFVYKNRILRHFNDKLEFDNGSGTFTAFSGSYTEPDSSLRMKGQLLNSNFYFTTDEGIKKISALFASEFTGAANYITSAGVARALELEATLTGITGFLPVNYNVAYRLVWGTRDVNNNLILGSPSANLRVSNNGATSTDVTISSVIPSKINTVNFFFQVYRSAIVNNADPGDELHLVWEQTLTSTDLTNGFVSFTDELPDELAVNGANLYTNAQTGQGIAQANDLPPIAKDFDTFRGSTFYGNTKTAQVLSLTLVGVADLGNAVAPSLNALFIKQGAVTRQYSFQEYTSPTPDPTANTIDGGIIGIETPIIDIAGSIDATARKLCKIINKDPSAGVYAFYLSVGTGLPGEILLEARDLNADPFYLAVGLDAIKNKFNPELPVYPGVGTFPLTVGSDDEQLPNRIYYSKVNQPEAVPSANTLDIGTQDSAILRVIALRDNMFILKEDGVYIITGSTAPDFSVRLLDNSAKITAADTAVVLSNRIYCLSTQGVIAISDAGVSIVSRPIENLILGVTNSKYNFQYMSFSIASESDRAFIMWLPTLTSDDVATQAYRYNIFTNTWTRWTNSATAGIVNSFDDKIYLGAGDLNTISQERKNFDRTDYADRSFLTSFIEGGLNGASLVMSNASNLKVGDSLVQIQYVTIAQANRLMKSLDFDPFLSISLAAGGAGYFNTVGALVPGDVLKNKLQTLHDTIYNDPSLDQGIWGAPIVFVDDFVANQTLYNDMVDRLNDPAQVTFYKQYKTSDNTVTYEALIIDINKATNTITLSNETPYLFSPVSVLRAYEAIISEMQWSAQHFGAPEMMKQVNQNTIIFESNNFYNAQVGYFTDLSRNLDNVVILGRGIGNWGSFDWGENFWGGEGSGTPFRTLVPREKQRSRYLTVRFTHFNAREKYKLLGMSLEPRQISTRAYR